LAAGGTLRTPIAHKARASECLSAPCASAGACVMMDQAERLIRFQRPCKGEWCSAQCVHPPDAARFDWLHGCSSLFELLTAVRKDRVFAPRACLRAHLGTTESCVAPVL